jgi:ATP-dependent RNA helicase DHX8/PRP22
MPDTALPEVQRTSLVGAVLYLKSLQLDIDLLTFAFLDRPELAALQDALRQLLVGGACRAGRVLLGSGG